MGAFLVLPSLLVMSSPWWPTTYWLVPQGPDRTEVHLMVRAPAGSDPAAVEADVRHFVDGDVWACQEVQAAVDSGTCEGPQPAPHSRPDHPLTRTDEEQP